ncbi:carbohydrate ABC transporter permease [Paenibacillus mesophilus]|uniref:carbohydrate ABC transporter permease n=1 Tax=Paenibacillus mesophilus TaxID=2582849 RepID=UPI00110D492D|nr:carbohydrate ABC transporter permease [Paenibacillus mesophilus]TMV49599.1 carbohydrate ABC transporter permease [Paenibacillus mesophilus]
MGIRKYRLIDCIQIVLMLLVLVATLYPLYYMAIVSVSAGDAVGRGEVMWMPAGINWKAYGMILGDPSIMRAYGNTLLYTSLGLIVNMCMTALCAYPLSRDILYGRSWISLFVVFTMLFDGGLIPRYRVVHALGMVDTIWALLLPAAIQVFHMMLMRTFFEQIPTALHEAAYLDGAGEMRILLRIVLPLSLPVLATLSLFYAASHWNSFLPALIYLNEKRLYPLQIVLRNIVIQGEMAAQGSNMAEAGGTAVTALNIKYALVVAAILPILCIYPFAQKYFVQGAMIGAVKG